MGGIFRTFSNTWSLTKTSMVVLRMDRELLLFPIMAFIGVAIIAGIAAAVLASTGAFERLDTTGASGEGAELQGSDIAVLVVALFAAMFVINYFNAALMGAARHRLKGGDPNLGTGFAAVNKHVGAVFGWSVIGTIIMLLLMYARSKSNSFIGRMLIGIAGAIWAYATFFVLPVLIIEGVGPIEAIKRSSGHLRRTWGEQFVSNFGFGILRFLAVLPAVLVGALLFTLSPVAGIVAVVPLLAVGLAIVNALEGIFKMALYEHVVEGVEPQFFNKEVLANAYGPRGTGAYRSSPY